MRPDLRYVVYGAGAVGGVIGAHLHRAGVDVTLVARGEHLAALQEHGLRLDSPDGSELVSIPAVGGAAEVAWTDGTVVLLTVKSQQTAAALDDLAAHAPSTTPVVSVQNGVANEDAVLRRFQHTYSVCVMLPSAHLVPGAVVQKCSPIPGILDIGRIPRRTDDLDVAIAEDLRRAGFESQPRPDILAWKYRKLVLNLGNGVDAVCAPGPDTDELARRARDEGDLVLRLAGIVAVSPEEDAERRGDILRPGDGSWRAGGSTWQSVQRRAGSVEIDYLAGEVVLLGRRHGIPTPVNELIQHVVSELARTGGAPRSLEAGELLARLP
jgi:2-dehydropantoate 2-reductase